MGINLGETLGKKLIADKQNYFTQKWLKHRVVVNQYILNILRVIELACGIPIISKISILLLIKGFLLKLICYIV